MPAAFDAFDRASACFAEARYEGPFARSVRLDHARTLLQANLLEEAVEAADRAVIESEATEGDLELAESLLVAAEAHLASGDITGAADPRSAASGTSSSTTAQPGRHWPDPSCCVHGGPAVAARGSPSRWRPTPNAPPVRLPPRSRPPPPGRRGAAHRAAPRRAGRRAAGRSRPDRRELRGPAGGCPADHGLPGVVRGRLQRARRAVNQGVRILNDHHAVLGAIELRAFAAASSIGLARIGVQLAVDDRRARGFLDHLEATRRTVSLLPAAQPPDDEVLADLLARLRLVTAQHQDAISAGAPTDHFERERAALERRIRWHARRAPAGGEVTELTIGESLSLLGDRALIEYADLDGRLYAVSVIGRRSVLHDLGVADGLAAHIDSSAFTLHRLNRTQGSVASRAASVCRAR